MKITLLIVGKTEDAYLKEGIDKYLKRLKFYAKVEITEIAELKNTKALTEQQQNRGADQRNRHQQPDIAQPARRVHTLFHVQGPFST